MRLKPLKVHSVSCPTEEKLRKVEPIVSTARDTGAAIGSSHTNIWLWRRGAAVLTPKQVTRLLKYVTGKLRSINEALQE